MMKNRKTVSFRMLSALCALLILCSVPFTAFADWGPGPCDLRGINERVEYPRSGSWLDSYETMYVQTKHGVRAYLRYSPSSDSDYYAYVYEEDCVTVLARQNGYSLVKTNEGSAGWVTSSVLVYRYGSTSGSNYYSGSSSSRVPGPHDMTGCNDRVEDPAWTSWLDSYETLYVRTRHGVRAYLRYSPDSNSDYYDYVYEADAVTVLARENGFSLVKTADGKVGWVTSSVLVYRY